MRTSLEYSANLNNLAGYLSRKKKALVLAWLTLKVLLNCIGGIYGWKVSWAREPKSFLLYPNTAPGSYLRNISVVAWSGQLKRAHLYLLPFLKSEIMIPYRKSWA